MTFSVAACEGDALGVAVASKFLAVGALVPAAATGAGALATQAAANLEYRPTGLALLREGEPAGRVVERLVAADPDRAERQVGIVDRHGGSASYTGPGCHAWAGGVHGPGFAIQGNLLAGPQVVDAMLHGWREGGANAGAGPGPLANRLLATLAAGDAAGGDRRGRQSAALLVVAPEAGYGGTSDVAVDLRVDDHPEPVAELARLLALHERYFSRSDPADLLPLTGPLAGDVARLLAARGFPPAGDGPGEVAAALRDWAGVENLEERVGRDGFVDPVVLEVLRGGTS